MRVMVVIPARGGSKGLPGKNLKPIAGISLVARATRIGRAFLSQTGVEGVVFVDTDSEEIAAEAKKWGASVPFLRAAHLAVDTTPMADNVLAAADRLGGVDTVVLLQPTSPLRTVDDVVGCWQLFKEAPTSTVLSVVETDHPAEQTFRLTDGVLAWAWPELLPDRRRQDLPRGYRPSGSVYIITLDALRKANTFLISGVSLGFVTPRERAVDVDTAEDLALAEALASVEPARSIQINHRVTGMDRPTFVMANIGVDHGGDATRARRLVDIAADAGANAITFDPFAPSHRLSLSTLESLQTQARDRAIALIVSVRNQQSFDVLHSFEVDALSLTKPEELFEPQWQSLMRDKKPLLLSVDASDLAGVAQQFEQLPLGALPRLALIHRSRDASAEDTRPVLAALVAMRTALRAPVGWSILENRVALASAAAARGVELIEVSLRLNAVGSKEIDDPGYAKLGDVVTAVRVVDAAMGRSLHSIAGLEAHLA